MHNYWQAIPELAPHYCHFPPGPLSTLPWWSPCPAWARQIWSLLGNVRDIAILSKCLFRSWWGSRYLELSNVGFQCYICSLCLFGRSETIRSCRLLMHIIISRLRAVLIGDCFPPLLPTCVDLQTVKTFHWFGCMSYVFSTLLFNLRLTWMV